MHRATKLVVALARSMRSRKVAENSSAIVGTGVFVERRRPGRRGEVISAQPVLPDDDRI
jgi:hypothetical protein